MLDFRRLLYFCTIVEQGQISRAARVLHVSQPTLSLSLRELEDELGLTLIHREGGKWQVTERGQSFYLDAQRILTQLEDLSENARDPLARRSDVFGEVRVGCSGFCLTFLKDMLPRMEQEYPGVRIRVMTADNLALETKVRRRDVDFAILQLPLVFTDFEIVPLREQHLVAVWSPLLETPPQGPAPLEAISRHPLMIARRWSNRGALRPFIIAMQKKGLMPRIILDTPLAPFLLDALPLLPAVAILHDTEITPAHASSFAVRRVDLPEVVFHPAIIWLRGIYLSPQCERIIALLRETAGADRPA